MAPCAQATLGKNLGLPAGIAIGMNALLRPGTCTIGKARRPSSCLAMNGLLTKETTMGLDLRCAPSGANTIGHSSWDAFDLLFPHPNLLDLLYPTPARRCQ
jgi:hypothetical protein